MTKTQLAAAVLKRLAVIGNSESADADDAALVTGIYDSIYPQLRKLEIAPFSATSIDAWAERAIVKIVAAEAGPEFGWADRAQILELWKRQGMKELYEQTANKPRPTPVKADYL